MSTTAETPAEPPVKTNRRSRWIAAGAAVALGIGVVAIALSKNEVKAAVGVPSGGGLIPDPKVSVNGHSRRQSYGPHYSLHRDIQIDPYLRGQRRAA